MLMLETEITNSTMTEEAAALLMENIKFFIRTPKGSLPLMRGYGFDYSIIDEPFQIFRTKATVDIVTGIRNYYGVTLNTIDIKADENGNITIEISI